MEYWKGGERSQSLYSGLLLHAGFVARLKSLQNLPKENEKVRKEIQCGSLCHYSSRETIDNICSVSSGCVLNGNTREACCECENCTAPFWRLLSCVCVYEGLYSHYLYSTILAWPWRMVFSS